LAPSKIASIGVKVDARGVSRHGFALNVATDMSYWKGIIACGLENQNQISLEYLLDPAPGMERVMKEVVKAFGATFGYKMQVTERVAQI
jgi:lipoate-protein ligase B